MPLDRDNTTQARLSMMEDIIAIVRKDLNCCISLTKKGEEHDLICVLQRNILDVLADVKTKVGAYQVHPDIPLRLSIMDPPVKWRDEYMCKTQRVGFLAATADPIHWGHLFLALCAISELSLNCVVVQIMGDHPHKLGMKQPKEHRHAIARCALDLFHPLLRYSPMGYANLKIGEENAAELLLLHFGLPLELHYIAGGDVHDIAAANLEACRTLLIPRDGTPRPELLGFFFPRGDDHVSRQEMLDKYPFIRFAAKKYEPFPKVHGRWLGSGIFRSDPNVPLLPTPAIEYIKSHNLYRGAQAYDQYTKSEGLLCSTVLTTFLPPDLFRIAENRFENLSEVGPLVPNGPIIKSWRLSNALVSIVNGSNTEMTILPLVRRPEVDTIIALCFCGALKSDVQVGDVVIPFAAIRGEPTMSYWQDPRIPAVADFDLVAHLRDSVMGVPVHVGLVYTNSFMVNERNLLWEFAGDRILSVDAHVAKFLTLCNIHGKRAIAVCLVSERAIVGQLTYKAGKESPDVLQTGLCYILDAFERVLPLFNCPNFSLRSS